MVDLKTPLYHRAMMDHHGGHDGAKFVQSYLGPLRKNRRGDFFGGRTVTAESPQPLGAFALSPDPVADASFESPVLRLEVGATPDGIVVALSGIPGHPDKFPDN